MKRDGRKLDHTTLEVIRQMAMERIREGETPASVIASFGFCRTTVYKWIRRTSGPGNGLRALRSRKATGRPRLLTAAQERQLIRWISRKSPDAFQIAAPRWTRPAIARLVHQQFGVDIGISTVGEILRRHQSRTSSSSDHRS